MCSQAALRGLGIAGSLRHASFNRATLRAAQQLAPEGAKIESFDIAPSPRMVRGRVFRAVAETLGARVKAADELCACRISRSTARGLRSWAPRPAPSAAVVGYAESDPDQGEWRC